MHSDLIYVPDMGQIGCGSIVPFEPRGREIQIPRPPNTRDSDEIFTHDVSGDSLYNPDNPSMSAYNGDRLICKATFEASEVKPHKVCVVFIQPTCERIAKRVKVIGNDIYLSSLNPKYPVRKYPKQFIEIKGIVLGVHHYW